MENGMTSVTMTEQKTLTSLELCEQINIARMNVSDKTGKKYKEYKHKDLLVKCREEIEAMEIMGEISGRNISPSKYVNDRGKSFTMYIIKLSNAKMLMASEVPAVRVVVAKYIDSLEETIQRLQQDSYMISDPITRAKAWIKEEEERIELKEKLVIAHRTKGQIADKQTATAMATASAMVRKNKTLEREKEELQHTLDAVEPVIEYVSDINEKHYTATELGAIIHIGPQQMNGLLKKAGLQFDEKVRGKKVWYTTELGAQYVDTKTTTITPNGWNGCFDVSYLIWSKRVLDVIDY